MKTINFDPEGDTIPVLFDQYDDVCKNYFDENEESKDHKDRIFDFTHFYEKDEVSKLNRFLPRFSHISFFVQMPHVDIEKKVREMKAADLTDFDKAELELRVTYAQKWLKTCSPEKYIFTVLDEVPETARDLSPEQKKFLGDLASVLGEKNWEGEELHSKIHELKEASSLTPQELFGAIYVAILGKNHGPKVGWFLEALEKDFLINRFQAISEL